MKRTGQILIAVALVLVIAFVADKVRNSPTLEKRVAQEREQNTRDAATIKAALAGDTTITGYAKDEWDVHIEYLVMMHSLSSSLADSAKKLVTE